MMDKVYKFIIWFLLLMLFILAIISMLIGSIEIYIACPIAIASILGMASISLKE